MDLKQLRALVTIAETGSVTRAADILHIVQPALSRQVKLLEEELGVPLFDRERHGMVLTTAGRVFVERVRSALRELDAGKEEIRPRKQQISGNVVVGFLPSAADILVSLLMGRMRQAHPRVTLRSYIAYVADLQRCLERGEVDIALLYLLDEAAERLQCEALLEESLFLVGPPDAALDLDTPMPLEGLNEVPLVLPVRPHGIRMMVERACEAAGVKLTIAAESASISLQKTLVQKGVGLAILSSSVVFEEVSHGLLTACPITSLDIRRKLYLGRTPAKALSPAAATALDELRTTVRQEVTEGRWPGAVLLS